MVLRWLAVVALLAGVAVAAGQPASAAPRAHPAPAVRIMPFGDSITYGVGSATSSGYRAPLWERLVGESGYRIDFVGSVRSGRLADTRNEGHPGWNIDRLSRDAARWVATYRPDVVLLHAGTNDVRAGSPLLTTARRLGELIGRIRAAAPRATVLVAKIVPSADPVVNARIVAFNEHVPGIVAGANDPHVRLVDLYSALSRSTDLHDWLHPNDAGYAKMAAVWAAALADVLPPPRSAAAR